MKSSKDVERTTEDARNNVDDFPLYLAKAEDRIAEASAKGLWGTDLLVPERLHYVLKTQLNALGYYAFIARFPNGSSTSKVSIFWSPCYQALINEPEQPQKLFRRMFG